MMMMVVMMLMVNDNDDVDDDADDNIDNYDADDVDGVEDGDDDDGDDDDDDGDRNDHDGYNGQNGGDYDDDEDDDDGGDDDGDGGDNDCDGLIDEDHVNTRISCGLGVCQQDGLLECENGEIKASCSAMNIAPDEIDNSCNNLDDDCDGLIDEGYINTAVDCNNEGACAESSRTICQDGTVLDTCYVGSPTTEQDETCDGVDDDCDGVVDENYVATEISCGVGVCANSGRENVSMDAYKMIVNLPEEVI